LKVFSSKLLSTRGPLQGLRPTRIAGAAGP